MTGPRPGSRRRGLLLVVALLAALLVCTAQAVAVHRFRDPTPDQTPVVGVDTTVGGLRLRLERFTVAGRLPARETPDPPVTALAGAELVQVVLRVEVVDESTDLETLYCDFSLVDDRGRRWTRASDIEYKLAGPSRITCSGSSDEPVRRHEPYEVGVAFSVPADVADQVRFRLRLSTERQTVEFRR